MIIPKLQIISMEDIMKSLNLRIFSFLLCISLLLPICACQKKEEPDDSSNVSAAVTEFELGGEYNIVRGEYYVKNDETIKAMQYVKEAVEAVYGETPNLCDDWQKTDEVNEYEILIGDTNRKQSKQALADLGVNDYTYYVESQNVIVICGGTPEATLSAAIKFCADVLGYDVDEKSVKEQNVPINVSSKYTYSDAYDYQSTTVGGIDVKDFTIAIESEKYMAYAYEAAKIFAKHSGGVMSITSYERLTGDEKAVICIGATDRNGENAMKSDHEGYLITSLAGNGKLTVGIAVSNDKFYDNALKALERNVTLTAEQTNAVLTLPDNDVYGFDFEDDIPTWYLKEEKNENVADGVVYTVQTYVDDENKPYKAHILTIDPTKATFTMGTSNDGKDYTLTKEQRQTTLNHMKAAADNGANVLAGINADFFAISSDYHPSGLSVKDGVVIGKGSSGRPYLGFTKEGKVIIGANGAVADTTNLQTAVGGSHIIVKDGLPDDLDMDDAFGYTSHPRTLAGVKEDGTVVLAVIDGRQEKVSNGAPLARCASFMISLGCVDAINLDGGGSSNLLIKKGSTYQTKNSPSDGGLRKVYNSLLVIGK